MQDDLRRRPKSRPGRIAWLLVLVLAAAACLLALGLGLGLAAHASKRAEIRLPGCKLTEVARLGTGLQRAERLAFADHGRLLAVSCPRYHRIALYRLDGDKTPRRQPDIVLTGRPVAICPVADRVHVLVRPPGDARHLEPGSWVTFDLDGRPLGSPSRVGFYPDDLAFTADGRHALVLTSGRAEGDAQKPLPALAVIELGASADSHREIARVSFDQAGDDPDRLILDPTGRAAIVTLLGTDQALEIDLSNLGQPRLVGRSKPGPAADLNMVRLDLPGAGPCLAVARPKGSGLDLVAADTHRLLGHLPLRGALNLSPMRPTGVALASEPGLIAVANRSGGVHLIAIRPDPDQRAVADAESGSEPAVKRR